MKERLNLPQFSSLLAILCAIHCALMPVILTLAPVLASWLSDAHWLEWLLMGSALAMGSVPVIRGYRAHGVFRPALLLMAGFLCIFLPHLLAATHLWEYLFSFAGAVLLVTAQIQNIHYNQKCSCQLTPVK